MLGKIISNWH